MNDRRRDDSAPDESGADASERAGPPPDRADDTDPAAGATDSPASTPPSDPESSGADSEPEPTASNGWAPLAVALAVVSLATAGTTAAVYDAATAATGAAALGLGFVVLATLAFTDGSNVVDALDAGWAEHRRDFGFATALFGGGILLGGALVAVGVDLSEFFLELLTEEFDEDEFAEGGGGGIELSATFFLVQNTPPFLAAILGALTLGLVTVIIMVFNGILVGNLAVVVGLEIGFGPIVALLVPHGIFELPALFIASGIGFRLLHRALQRIAGTRDALFTRAYLSRTTVLAVFGWLLLALAAFVEAYLTIVIAEALFPQLTE
jgi:uncharacterized membrane protein SpoIIM required for sporulation